LGGPGGAGSCWDGRKELPGHTKDGWAWAGLNLADPRPVGQGMSGERWDGWGLTDPHKAGMDWADLKPTYRNRSGAHRGGLCWTGQKDGCSWNAERWAGHNWKGLGR